MKNNQRGFGVVEILVVVLVLGLIATIGWLVWDRQNNTSDSSKAGTKTSLTKSNDKAVEAKRLTLIESDGVKLSSEALPDGWKLNASCEDGETSKIILPPAKSSVRCGSEDWGFVFIEVKSADGTELKNCSNEQVTREQHSQYQGYVSYSCEELMVDSVKGVQEVSVSNEMAPFTGGDTYNEYTFVLTNNKVVKASFTNPNDFKKPEYNAAFDSLVKSFKF